MVGVRLVDDDTERRSWAPRILAPLAFFTAATILVLLVNSAMNSGDDPEADAPRRASQPRAGTTADSPPPTTTRPVPRANRRFYRIETGDTLDAIAIRFDTTVEDLRRLNPGIDETALTPGQRIRVR